MCLCMSAYPSLFGPFTATIEYESKLRHENEMARVRAEIEGK